MTTKHQSLQVSHVMAQVQLIKCHRKTIATADKQLGNIRGYIDLLKDLLEEARNEEEDILSCTGE